MLEILVVLAILALVATFAGPQVLKYLAGAKSDTADPVRRPDVVHHAPPQAVIGRGVPLARRHGPGLGPVTLDDRLQAGRDVGHRFVPAHALPFARAAFADATQRVHEAAGVREAALLLDPRQTVHVTEAVVTYVAVDENRRPIPVD